MVVDEPLYGFYLARTGVAHPGRDEVIQTMNNGWREVIDELTLAPLPAGKTVFYAKHMTHHLLPEVDRGALAGLRHAYLIRDPRAAARVLRQGPGPAGAGRPGPGAAGGDLPDVRRARWWTPADILRQPEPALRALCDALGVPFDPAMLSWPAGPRDTDGVWARHWYDGVWRSTGFGLPAGDTELPPELPPEAAARPGMSPTASGRDPLLTAPRNRPPCRAIARNHDPAEAPHAASASTSATVT